MRDGLLALLRRIGDAPRALVLRGRCLVRRERPTAGVAERNRLPALLWCCLLVQILGAVRGCEPAYAATYWVSPSGNGANSGADSSSNAKTLAWFNANAVQGDVCRFKSGTYSDAIWPGNGTSSSARQNQLRYYGFPQDPNAVTVASIRLAGKATATSNPKAGDSCSVRWIRATGRIEGSPTYPGSGAVTTVAVRDSIVKCSGVGNLEWGSQSSVYDSLTIALDGTAAELIDAYTAGVAGTGLRPQNNQIKNSTFTATVNRVGQQHVLAAAYGGFNTIFGNTFNLTMTSCSDYWFPVEFYHQSNNLLQSNVWNITMNATPAGTHAIWAYRDTATSGGTTSSHRFVGNTVTVTGTGTIDLGLSQSGSQSGATGGNYVGYNVISIQTPANGAFYWQNGARGDTVEFNVVKTGTGGVHNVAVYNASTAFQNTIVRHNTFYSSTATVVDIGPSTPATGSRFASNIYYGTSANGSGSESVIVPSGMGLDSAGVVFNPGGSAAFGFKVGGVAGTPGSGGNYGAAGKALWGSPRFTDSTYAALNTTLLAGSLAQGGSLQDGFAGAVGTATSPPPAADMHIDLRHTSNGVIGGNTTLHCVITNVGNGVSNGLLLGNFDYGTGVGYVTDTNDGRNWANDLHGGAIEYDDPIAAGDSVWFEVTISTDVTAAPSTINTATLSGLSDVYTPDPSTYPSDPDTLPVGAALGSSFASWQVTPGYYSIGARVFVLADADSDATVQLFSRVHGAASWDSATTCFRRYGGGFDGIVTGCSPGTSYDVRADLTDPDGGSTTVSSTLSTKAYRCTVTGPLVYVAPAAAGGSDANAGTLASPKLTIGAALGTLVAKANEGRGGGIVLKPGIYQVDQAIQSGDATADTLYHLMGDGTNPDSTIVDGSVGKTFTWARYSASAFRDSIFYVAGAGNDSCTSIFRGWAKRLHNFATLTALDADSTALAEGFALKKGATSASDTLFVKTTDNIAPGSGELFHLGKQGEGIWIQRPYWHLSNFSIRYQGGGAFGNGIGVRLGGGSEVARGSGCVLDSLRIYGTGTHAIYGTDGGQPSWCDTVLVRNCTLDGRGIDAWPYLTCKNGNCEVHGIFAPGCAWGVFNNDVTGYFDGIDLDDFTGGGGSFLSTDSTGASDAEIAYNNVHNILDDGAELDGSAGINRRYFSNTFRDGNFGLSFAPITQGPNWVYNNVLTRNDQGGLKLGSITTLGAGRVALYHNTIVGTPGAFFAPMYHIANGFRRLRSRNNVFIATGSGAYVMRDLDMASDQAGRASSDFDYDMVDTTSSANRLWAWKNVAYSLASLRSTLGFESHGLLGRASFRDSSAAALDYRLVKASAAVGAGLRIPGINTPAFGVRRYFGRTPDAGARQLHLLTEDK